MVGLVGTREACAALGVSAYTARKLARAGALPALKVGGVWRYDLDALRIPKRETETEKRGNDGRVEKP